MQTTTAPTADCPLCGADDATLITYNGARHDLRVDHTDGTYCTAAPVDIEGNPAGARQ